jgi:hypothetical protein
LNKIYYHPKTPFSIVPLCPNHRKPTKHTEEGVGKREGKRREPLLLKKQRKKPKNLGTYHPERREPVQKAGESHILMALLAIWIDV